MKRPSSSSDSLGGDVGGACILSICPSSSAAHEEKSMYGRGFQSLLDGLEEDECGEEDLCSGGVAGGGGGEKKRRLSTEQVRALERSFEVENKLEPERKLRLAQDLGLQPRQVAVWFQNRRARWKTKQLERDFCALRANYDTLKLECDSLHRDKESLLAEIKELKTKLSSSPEEESFCSDKETASDKNQTPTWADKDPRLPPTLIYKDGSSDSSDSSAVVNEESSPCQGFSSSTITPLHKHQHQEMQHNKLNSASGSGSTSSEFYYHHQLMKMEEFEEPCSSFFNDEQAPTLNWCLL